MGYFPPHSDYNPRSRVGLDDLLAPEIIHKFLKMHIILTSLQGIFLDDLLPIVQFTWYHSLHKTYVGHYQSFARRAAVKGITNMSIAEFPSTPATPPLFERISEATKVEVVRELSALLGARYVLHTPYDLMLYEYDASIDRSTPDIVVLPASTEEVAAIVKIASRHNVPVVPRGAGTGLSGGAIPIFGGIIIVFARMNRILEIDYTNLRAVVQPGW